MVLKIHEPEAAMDGQVIRISNKDRPTSWITFHFESENDARPSDRPAQGRTAEGS
jgi:hypothetical protein